MATPSDNGKNDRTATRRAMMQSTGVMGALMAAGGYGVWRLTAGGVSQAAATLAKFEIEKTEAEWRRILTPAQFHVLREEGTERPDTSPLVEEHRKGTFACAGCDLPLFSSDTKYDSGTGWPSFYQPLPNAVGTAVDKSLFMERVEVFCRRCGGHLGHVFDDGPAPTGKRYCMNGVAMKFKPA